MVIVAGHITVDPEQRETYLAGSMSVVEKARQADGCLDFAITADLLDPWPRQPVRTLGVARGRQDLPPQGPQNKQRAAMLSMSVAEYDIADVRPLFGKGKA